MKAQVAAVATEVKVPAGDSNSSLPGILVIPEGANGLVLFAHGSGSGRNSPRNQYVASALHNARLGTLLIDLLTESEADDRANVFDIPLLAARVNAAARWLRSDGRSAGLRIGVFGASTGAAAALAAAAADHEIAAVVSRGGRPDLAGGCLARVVAPSLLIVGGRDSVVIDLNRQAFDELTCPKEMDIVPGATHLFEEPGTLERVSELAQAWFITHLAEGASP